MPRLIPICRIQLTLSVLDWKYPFLANLIQRYIEYVEFNGGGHSFWF